MPKTPTAKPAARPAQRDKDRPQDPQTEGDLANEEPEPDPRKVSPGSPSGTDMGDGAGQQPQRRDYPERDQER